MLKVSYSCMYQPYYQHTIEQFISDTNDEKKFYLEFLKHLLSSVSKITRKDSHVRSMGKALNCQNIYGNEKMKM